MSCNEAGVSEMDECGKRETLRYMMGSTFDKRIGMIYSPRLGNIPDLPAFQNAKVNSNL
jgi:hypothetical protein